jgi:tRNA (guanine37-N1)-methyltransferase
MNFHIITLFPESFSSYLGESIIKRAIEDKKIKVKFYNPRDYAENKWKHVDQKPYGGGPGMVIQAEPVMYAVEAAIKKIKNKKNIKIIFFSPQGKQFDTSYAKKLSKSYTDIILICGRYEGIDARVRQVLKSKEFKKYNLEEISVGPFVLTGGELPAMIVLDSVSRQIEGVLGNFNSLEESRSGHELASDYVYTRPEVIEYKSKKYRVPKILLSGHRKKIEEWKSARVGKSK